MRLFTVTIALFFAFANAAVANSVALIIGNENYQTLPNAKRSQRVSRAIRSLENAGFSVSASRNANLANLNAALNQYGKTAVQAERQIIVLAGRFLKTASETYYMPVDAPAGPLASLHRQGLPLSTVMAWLAATPGQSVLILTTDNTERAYGPFIDTGIGPLDLPQGVTLVTGGPSGAEDFIKRIAQGQNVLASAKKEGMSVAGFITNGMALSAKAQPNTFNEPKIEPDTSANNRVSDITAWRKADQADTAEAYQAYIQEFPQGAFVAQARSRIARLTDTPEKRAERAETALALTRDQRRELQRMLTLLDFNTRGIDGIFGRGTRAAISSWQSAQGFAATGFFNRDQIVRLDAQAERRSAELEAEAERRRAQQLVEDRAFWDETGAIGDEAGYRAYLSRYPDGEFAEVAIERLADMERQKRRNASSRDRRLWDQVTQINSAEAYREYLRIAPNGAFRDDAFAKLDELEVAEQNAANNSKAAQGERALNLSSGTKKVIEKRLDSLGLRPGPVDGTLDDDSRRAIRRYQAARNMEETGYLSEALVVRMLADSVRSILR